MTKTTASLSLALILGLGVLAGSGYAAPIQPKALADLGVPAINIDDTMALLGFAGSMSYFDKGALEARCAAILAAPATYGDDAAAYCRNFVLATLTAPVPRSEPEN